MCGLWKVFPKSAVINVFFPKQTQDSRSATKELPRTITSLYHPRYKKLSTSMLLRESQRVFDKELVVTDAESKYLMQCTRLQSQSSQWFEHRKGRLTASRFGAICCTFLDKPSQSLVTQLLQQSQSSKCAALSWGTENESEA